MELLEDGIEENMGDLEFRDEGFKTSVYLHSS